MIPPDGWLGTTLGACYSFFMHEINDAIVQGGKVVLSQLPYPDGQHVRILIAEQDHPSQRLTIQQVRELLKGGVERFDEPLEPMIPGESWEMLK